MFLLWIILVATRSEGGVTGQVTGTATCESGRLGETAQVTCHFGQNVVEASDVSAVLLGRLDGKREMVVECYRYFDKDFDCLPLDGYRIKDTISDKMIINIPSTRPEHQGAYACAVVRKESIHQMASCVLEYKESDKATTSASPSEQENDDHRKEDAGTSVLVAAVTTLSVLLPVVMMVNALFVIVCRRRRRRHNRRQQDKDVEMHDLANHSLLYPGDGDGPDKKDARQISYKRTKVKDSSGGVSIITTRDASPECSLKELSISARSHICDNHDVTANSQSTNEVHSVTDKKPCTDDNSQCGDHMIQTPVAKTFSNLERPRSDYFNPCIDTRCTDLCARLHMLELKQRSTHRCNHK